MTRFSSARIVGALVAFALCGQAYGEPELPKAAKDDNVYPIYDSNWAPYIALGAQFLPDYDENGRSSGLSKQQFFAMITVDGRFGDNRKPATGTQQGTGKGKEEEKDTFDWRHPFRSPFHTGVTVSLLGTPIKREDKPSVSPKEFNDVAQTIVSSAYVFMPAIHQSNDSGHNAGPIARVGAISRESLGSSGDSVNWFYSVGLQYSSERFMSEAYADDKQRLPRNGVPEGYIRFSAARFENYAGLGRKTRLVGDAALRIYPKLNMFLGVQGNFGNGPDEFMLVVSMARQPQEIANLFALGKTD